MQQMSPMLWLLIMIFSIMMFLLMNFMCYSYWNSINIKNYFNKNSYKKKKSLMNYIKW